MIDGKRVCAFTPFGREKTVSILHKYLARDHAKGIVDEWWLCLNTDPDQVDDLRYGYHLAASEPDWVHALDRPDGLPFRVPKQRNTGAFYRYMTDPDTVYVRFDDDIVYVHEDAIANLVRAKIAMTSILACFPITWNNAIVSWYLQQAGIIPREYGVVERPFCMDPIGWASGDFGIAIHRLLLDKIEAGRVEDVYLYQDMPLAPGQQFSVSCFAVDGRDYASLEPPGVLPFDEEEACHTIHWPQICGKPNIIVGNAVVSHFTFGPQRQRPEHAALFEGEILPRYRALADAL